MSEAGKSGVISWNKFGYKWKGDGPFQRVTTIKSKKGSGNALIDWAARMVAERAQGIAESLRDGNITPQEAIVKLLDENLKNAHNETRDSAADFGTIFHHFVDNLASGDQDVLSVAEQEIDRVAIIQLAQRSGISLDDDRGIRLYEQKLDSLERDELAAMREAYHARLWPDIEAFLTWHDQEKPKFLRTEFQVFNRKYNYAGSVDADLELGGCRLLGDLKTSKSVYKDYALQLAAYRYAEFIGEPDGKESPVPVYDTGAIIHVRDGAVKVLEVDCGPGAFDAFTACWQLYRFDRFHAEPKEFQPRLNLTANTVIDASELFA